MKGQRAFWHAPPGFFGEIAAAVLAKGHVGFTGGDAYVVPGDNGQAEWGWNYWR